LPVGVGTAITLLAIPAYAVSVARLGVAGIAWTSVGVMGLYARALEWWWHRSAPAGAVGAALGGTVLSAVPAGAAGWWSGRALVDREGDDGKRTGLVLDGGVDPSGRRGGGDRCVDRHPGAGAQPRAQATETSERVAAVIGPDDVQRVLRMARL